MEENKEQKLNQNNLEVEESVGEAGADSLNRNQTSQENDADLKAEVEGDLNEKNQADSGEPSEFVKNLEKNIEIHSMPKRFRLDHGASKSSRKVGMIILILGFVILSGGVFAAYKIFFSADSSRNLTNNGDYIGDETNIENDEQVTQDQNEDDATAKAQAAKDAYLDFKKKILSIESLNAYGDLAGEYGTFKFVNDWAKIKSKLAGWPDEKQSELKDILKSFYPGTSALENLNAEYQKSSDEKVYLSALSSDYQVDARMIYDGDKWRVEQESGFSYRDKENKEIFNLDDWIQSVNDSLATTTKDTLQKSEDTDGDGLLDSEESILGTAKDLKDSDNDGYEDLVEINNLYNPAGAGKIEDNSALANYQNKDFNYSLIYPKDWTVSSVGGSDSLFITAASGELFQVAIQPNADKESIDDWYKSQFNVSEIDPGQRITVKNGSETAWSGIKSEDGMNIYLASPDQEYIFAIAYNPVQADILNYSNLFDLLVSTFRFSN